jgi:hypothetical protein
MRLKNNEKAPHTFPLEQVTGLTVSYESCGRRTYPHSN